MSLESLNTILEIVSAVLLGLTFCVGAGAIWTNHVLSQRQEGRIASVQRDTAEANKQAGEAFERAGEAEANLADANERAAKAQQAAAEANAKADEERIARLKIEAAMAPRRVSSEQEVILRKELAGIKNPNLGLDIVIGTPEVSDFAYDLEKAFKNAGLVVATNHVITTGATVRGLTMTGGQTGLVMLRLLPMRWGLQA
jgi:F0F1-type ATP synthase membrane subunit b/b'